MITNMSWVSQFRRTDVRSSSLSVIMSMGGNGTSRLSFSVDVPVSSSVAECDISLVESSLLAFTSFLSPLDLGACEPDRLKAGITIGVASRILPALRPSEKLTERAAVPWLPLV